jgi:hypothetical protein
MKTAALLFFMIFSVLIGEARAVMTFAWNMESISGITGYKIYRSYNSLTCEESFEVTNPSATSHSIPSIDFYGYRFYVMTAFGGSEESDYSGELLIRHCGSELCKADIVVNVSGLNVYVSWDYIPSISSYQIRYKDLASGVVQSQNASGTNATLTLTGGQWEIELFAKDSLGRVIENNNVFNKQVVTIYSAVRPEPPEYKVESFGAGNLQTLMIAPDGADQDVVYYVVNVFSRSALLLSGADGDILANRTIYRGENFCEPIDVGLVYDAALKKYKLTYPILFFTIYSVAANGLESDAHIGWTLIGNIVGTDNVVDGVTYEKISHEDAAVNGADYNAYKLYYFKPFTHRSSNYCTSPDLYNILPFTYQERADYNLDGVVNGSEYNLFKIVYGNTGAGY